MDVEPEDITSVALHRECSIRRTTYLLATKMKRIRDDLQQLVCHMGLPVPPVGISDHMTSAQEEVLQGALERIGDESFTQLVLGILQELR